MALDPKLLKYTTQGTIIATLPISDAISGTSFLNLNGAVLETSTEESLTDDESLILTDQSDIFSKVIEQEKASSNAPSDSGYDALTGVLWTYTMTQFNSTRVLEGTATITQCYAAHHTGGTLGNAIHVKMKYTIKKDGVEVASVFSSSGPAHGSTYNKVELMVVPMVIPRTTIAKNSIITLEVQAYGRNGAGGNRLATVTVGMDPKNRDGTQISPSTDDEQTTKLNIRLPFKP